MYPLFWHIFFVAYVFHWSGSDRSWYLSINQSGSLCAIAILRQTELSGTDTLILLGYTKLNKERRQIFPSVCLVYTSMQEGRFRICPNQAGCWNVLWYQGATPVQVEQCCLKCVHTRMAISVLQGCHSKSCLLRPIGL